MPTPMIKICGLTNVEDAVYSSEMGADILGVVMARSSPRMGNADLIRQLAARNYEVAGVYTDLESVKKEADLESYIQLHFPHGPEEIQFVREQLGKKVISVVLPDSETNIEKRVSSYLKNGADLVLIDFGREVTEEDAAEITDLSGSRVGVAGKISVKNVEAALKFKPYFIDLSSRLEKSPGVKDHGKIREFMEVFRTEAAAL